MPKPVLIIISGPPATGKTTLARQIAQKFSLPLFYKDGFKELLCDVVGCTDRQETKKLGLASSLLLYYVAEPLLATGQSLIVESSFHSDLATPEFLNLKSKCDFEPFQIQCRTAGEMLVQRHQARTDGGERHPSHFDQLYFEESQAVLLKGYQEPMQIGGQLYIVDTTDFATIDYTALFEAVKSTLERANLC